MTLALTLAIGAVATYLAAIAALRRGGISKAYVHQVSKAMIVSLLLSGIVFAIGAAWSVPADAVSTSTGIIHFEILHAWLVLVGPAVSFVIVPASYWATSELSLAGTHLNDRWRNYGFPSVVAAIYAGLTLWSFVTDPIGGWSMAPPWTYMLIPLHFIAVYASWILYLRGMDRWAAEN